MITIELDEHQATSIVFLIAAESDLNGAVDEVSVKMEEQTPSSGMRIEMSYLSLHAHSAQPNSVVGIVEEN